MRPPEIAVRRPSRSSRCRCGTRQKRQRDVLRGSNALDAQPARERHPVLRRVEHRRRVAIGRARGSSRGGDIVRVAPWRPAHETRSYTSAVVNAIESDAAGTAASPAAATAVGEVANSTWAGAPSVASVVPQCPASDDASGVGRLRDDGRRRSAHVVLHRRGGLPRRREHGLSDARPRGASAAHGGPRAAVESDGRRSVDGGALSEVYASDHRRLAGLRQQVVALLSQRSQGPVLRRPLPLPAPRIIRSMHPNRPA